MQLKVDRHTDMYRYLYICSSKLIVLQQSVHMHLYFFILQISVHVKLEVHNHRQSVHVKLEVVVTQISVHMKLEVDSHTDIGNFMPMYYSSISRMY